MFNSWRYFMRNDNNAMEYENMLGSEYKILVKTFENLKPFCP